MERCISGLEASVTTRMRLAQRASNWCWAASVSMVLRRYGLEVPQEQVVRQHWGSAANLPVPGEVLSGLLGRTWSDGAGRSVSLSARAQPAGPRNLAVSAGDVIADLAQERPLIIGSGRHAMVLVQVVYQRTAAAPDTGLHIEHAVVLDPAQGTLRSLRWPDQATDYLARILADGGS